MVAKEITKEGRKGRRKDGKEERMIRSRESREMDAKKGIQARKEGRKARQGKAKKKEGGKEYKEGIHGKKKEEGKRRKVARKDVGKGMKE